MALAPRLDLRQSQSLVMTPQLQQAIRLLALSTLEIEAYIAEEVEKNPLLEAGEAAAESADFGEDTFRCRSNLLYDHLLRWNKHRLHSATAFAPRLDRRNFAHVTPGT